MSKTIMLQGPPGSGKTTMACLTAVRKPVHVLDIDRKLIAMASLRSAITSKALTYWELTEPLVEGNLLERARELSGNKKPTKQPQGWIKIAEMIQRLEKDEEAQRAQTWVLDSFSMAVDHLVRLILYTSDKATAHMNQREWGALLQMCKETITIIIDGARTYDKDLIVTVHERVSEVPGPNTHVIRSAGGEREFIGQMNMRIAASVGGQFGLEMARYFEEVYGLSVEMKAGKPTWVCNVLPDGRRDLRTSFDVKGVAVHSCDFTKIWRQ